MGSMMECEEQPVDRFFNHQKAFRGLIKCEDGLGIFDRLQ